MCGIAGIISKSNIDEDVVERMTKSIAHRGPDGHGVAVRDGFAFGHRRLAIVDLSPDGAQPMSYMDRYLITYNGEIYNHIELRAELESQGYAFKSHSDTEVVMAAFDCWGVDCLNRFNGMWAFVLHDNQSNRFLISRDRFGIKPFLFHNDGASFVFGSEMKAIAEHPSVSLQPNDAYLRLFAKSGSQEYLPETAFAGIKRLPQATYLLGTVDELLGNLEPTKYWEVKPSLSIERFDSGQAKKYADEYFALLRDAVRLRLRADVPVGSALSGGLDSSSVVYLVNEILKDAEKPRRQETFSCVYRGEGAQHCDESEYIDHMSELMGLHSNQIEPPESEVPNEHGSMMRIVESPPHSTILSAWYTYKLVAGTDIKVTLDGQGADEQLGGYMGYVNSYLTSLSLPDFYREARVFYKNPQARKHVLVAIPMVHFRALLGYKILEWMVRRVLGIDFRSNLNDRLAHDMTHALETLLHYGDRNSMGFGIESRIPFMDYRLVEFLAAVPASYKLHNGWTKYLARLAFDGKLPDEVTWRKDKMGWPIPEDLWFRGGLKEWMHTVIAESKLVARLVPHFDFEKEVSTKKGLQKMVRYLNLARMAKIFDLK